MTARALPASASFVTAYVGRIYMVGIRENGMFHDTVLGVGTDKQAAQDMASDLYYERVYDRRRDRGLRIAETVWVHRSGETAKRVSKQEEADYLAQGYIKGLGKRAEPVAATA